MREIGIKETLGIIILNSIDDIITWDEIYVNFVNMHGENFEEKFRTFYDCVDEDMLELGYIFDEHENFYRLIKGE